MTRTLARRPSRARRRGASSFRDFQHFTHVRRASTASFPHLNVDAFPPSSLQQAVSPAVAAAVAAVVAAAVAAVAGVVDAAAVAADAAVAAA